MKKNRLFMFAVAAAIFASCSQESVIDSEVMKQSNAIGFSTYKSVTRGNPVDDNKEFMTVGNTFGVTAFISTEGITSPYMGYADHGAKIIYGTNWGYANENEKAFWPMKGETLDFYAYAPFGNDAITTTFNKTAGMTLNYTVPAAEADQVDVMYASAMAVGKPASGNSVNMPFKHALTQLHFRIATKAERLKIDIAANGVAINQVMGTGVLSLTAHNTSWSNLSTPANYTVTSEAITGEYTGLSTGYKTIGTANNALMLLPQQFAALSEGTGAYLTISCKIYQQLSDTEKVFLKGDADNYAVITIPISSTNAEGTEIWEMGKKLTYNLLISGNLTELDPIEFTTKVEGWDPVEGGVIENN